MAPSHQRLSLSLSLSLCNPLVLGLMVAGSCPAQRAVFATHDWSSQFGVQSDTWADTKAPGDGRVYSVGTTTISNLAGQYSDFHGAAVNLPGTFTLPDNSSKQVVVLQAADPQRPNGIDWQAYFFGADQFVSSGPQPSTFARGISVWPAVDAQGNRDDANTRIAICGETWDPDLPDCVAEPRPNWSTAFGPSGFIAVYNGNGILLWSNIYYGQAPSGSTAITDVSIRRNVATSTDIVTYCGMSTNGDYVANPPVLSTMTLERPFSPPGVPPSGCGVAYASGSYHNGVFPNTLATDWDGIVGRISVASGTVHRNFHCIVGGNGQDALFGIAEFNEHIFSVCGTTRGPVPNPTTDVAFPLTDPTYGQHAVCFGASSGWEMGVVLTFLDDPVTYPTSLQLIASYPIGSPQANTGAADLLWHGRAPNGPFLYIVGTTSDAALGIVPPNASAIQPTMFGSSDGYIAMGDFSHVVYASLLSDPTLLADTISAAAMRRGATGIAAWNEFHDHLAVVGWVEDTPATPGPAINGRITVDNLFRLDAGLQRVRRWVVDPASAGPRLDRPGTTVDAAFQNAQFSTSPQFVGSVGALPGGGAAVDSRGLVAVAGATFFPQPLGAPPFPTSGPASHIQPTEGAVQGNRDAVRVVADMLPVNVCRTDGVDCSALGWARSSGDGGTTPACARRLYGTTLNPAPSLERMFIDFEGIAAPGQLAAVLVDRPPAGVTSFGYLQLGFPPTDPVFLPALFPGIELWVNGQASVTLNYFTGLGSFREPLWGPAGLPLGSQQFSVQWISLLVSSLCGDPTFLYAASPALLIGY